MPVNVILTSWISDFMFMGNKSEYKCMCACLFLLQLVNIKCQPVNKWIGLTVKRNSSLGWNDTTCQPKSQLDQTTKTKAGSNGSCRLLFFLLCWMSKSFALPHTNKNTCLCPLWENYLATLDFYNNCTFLTEKIMYFYFQFSNVFFSVKHNMAWEFFSPRNILT